MTDHVPGTRSCRQFVLLDQNRNGSEGCNCDEAFCIHNFTTFFTHKQDIIKGMYAAIAYDKNLWIILVT